MENKLKELLGSLGLNKNEINVYLDILKNSPSTAYQIGYRINLYRSSVYDAIKKLHDKGLIVELIQNNKKLYQSKEYNVIEEYLNQKLVELKGLKPYLEKISETSLPKRSVTVSYGLTRLRATLTNLFDVKKDIMIWVLPKNINDILGDWFLKEIINKIKKNKTDVKIIFSESYREIKTVLKNSNIEARIFKENTNIFTIVSGDLIYMIVISNPMTVIEINNSNIADEFKTRFNVFWNNAKKI